jgi:cytochrome c-type biogenesis protein CcmH
VILLAAAAVLIASAAVWYVVRPLTRAVSTDTRERRHQLQLLRDRLIAQLNELDIEEGDRNIDAAVVADERARLEAELAQVLRELDTLKDTKKSRKQEKEARRVWITAMVVLGVVMPLSAAGLYVLGQRETLALLSNPQLQANPSVPPMVLEMVARLEKRLAEQPEDPAGWVRLGRAYSVLGRPQAAEAAFARAYQLAPEDPQVIAEYAVFLYNADPQNTGGPAFRLFTRLHQLQPDNPDALWFLGFASYQKADYPRALEFWSRLLKQLAPESPEAQHLRTIIAKTRENLSKK